MGIFARVFNGEFRAADATATVSHRCLLLGYHSLLCVDVNSLFLGDFVNGCWFFVLLAAAFVPVGTKFSIQFCVCVR